MLSSRFIGTLFAKLDTPQDFGVTPNGHRFIYHVLGGSFEGPDLKATVLPGGGDWLMLRPDGTAEMDVRGTMQTDDGALIHVYYKGRIDVPEELVERVLDHTTDDPIDPDKYYLRSAPFFETASPNHAWLNRITSIGKGRMGHGGVTYDIFAID